MHRMELLKAINFLKNLGLPKEELNKIGFIYRYEIVYIKKLLGHLRRRFVSASFILEMWFFQKSWIFWKIQAHQEKCWIK